MDVGELWTIGRTLVVGGKKTNRIFLTGNDSSVWTPYLKIQAVLVSQRNKCMSDKWVTEQEQVSLANQSVIGRPVRR